MVKILLYNKVGYSQEEGFIMSNEIIIARNLTKKYGTVLAVNNISFKIRKGDFFGFLGPNGAGKTSTVKMLTGLTSISAGEVKIFDKDVVKDAKFIKKRIGVVEDTSNLFPDLTVYENLLFKAKAFGVNYRIIREKIMNYLEMFNLSDKVKSKFLNLSRGQKRIVSIVSSLIHSPEVLFLDEPTLGLDINVRNKVHQLLLQLNKQEKVTIFLTSHYFEEVEKLCNRIAVINKGSLIFDGNIDKLKALFPGDKVISVELTTPIDEVRASKYFTHFKIEKNKLFITGDDVTLIIEGINRFVKDNKLKIKEINTEGNKLEDLFLRLLKDDER